MDLDFYSIKDNLSDYIHEKPHVFIIIALIILLFAMGLVVLFIQSSPKTVVEEPVEEFVADSPIISPDEPIIEKEYYPSRTTENHWSTEELNTWFSYPDGKAMSQLESVNDKIVDDIIGAAP